MNMPEKEPDISDLAATGQIDGSSLEPLLWKESPKISSPDLGGVGADTATSYGIAGQNHNTEAYFSQPPDDRIGSGTCPLEESDEQPKWLQKPPDVPLDVFPPQVQMMLENIAAACGVSIEIPIVNFLGFLSCLIGQAAAIEIKPGWQEGGNLWLAIVASSGMGKSPVQDKFIAPIKRHDYQALTEYKEAMAEYVQEKMAVAREKSKRPKGKEGNRG